MLRTRTLARLLIAVLGATALQTLVAEEPVGTTPPAQSIHDWLTTPSPTPAAQTLAAGQPAGPTPPARSIHEWMAKPGPIPGGCPTATPMANALAAAVTPATPAVGAAVPKTPITISITSTLREGNLVVVLDDVPIFSEKFQKPLLLISQTTRWDPLQVTAGKHRLSAKVLGTKKTFFSATYDLDVSRTKASELRFVMQGDKLTVELAS